MKNTFEIHNVSNCINIFYDKQNFHLCLVITCHCHAQHYDLNRTIKKHDKAHFLLVSGVTWIGEHLNVVTRLHHIMAHKRVDDGSLYHI